MDVLSRCACGGAPALYAPDVKSETKYAASVVCHHCGVSMQMANHDSDPKRVVAAWNRAHPHRINTMTVNEKGLEAAQVAAREGCGLFIESQHVFCDDPVVGEAADGYGKPLRQPYCSCKGDAERIIKAYLRAASKDAEPMAWIAEAGENKQPCLCWTEAVALSEAGGDRSRITPLFTHPFTGVEGGVKVKERDALIEAVADELVAHGEFSSIPGRNHANASKAAEAILPIILASIEPVAASPGVPDGWKLVPVEPTEAMMRAAMIALCLVPLLGGCDKKKPDGLPPATDWQAPAAGSSERQSTSMSLSSGFMPQLASTVPTVGFGVTARQS